MQASPDEKSTPDSALIDLQVKGMLSHLHWQEEQVRGLLSGLNLTQKRKCFLLLEKITRSSPYLSAIATRHPEFLAEYFHAGAERVLKDGIAELVPTDDIPLLRRRLRFMKQKLAFMIGLADIAGDWNLSAVTNALSVFAEKAVEVALSSLLLEAVKKKQWQVKDVDFPTFESGIFIFGMGKLGALELNYSSDIDLILFYDPDIAPYTGNQPLQSFLNRLTQDLVALLHERNADGYVFRTDLRLRPDPASTPPAIRTLAALHYYETVGQNWERAAMIKARVIAGDKVAGRIFQESMRPFIWRRHLDFAAINDILSIKRQMQSKSREAMKVPGHNIKTGRGGIREIEFFAQIHQLIWGGRYTELRVRGTLETLNLLANLDLLSQESLRQLCDSYVLYRTVEHRLQMMEDQQTHTVPEDEAELLKLAQFCGFDTSQQFCDTLLSHFRKVHHIFAEAFKQSSPLTEEGSLVFTGVDHDVATLATLREMGFNDPEHVSTAVMDWHKGNRRCTRTKRSREILTELMPVILKALAATKDSDDAFQRFDEFMERLPSGVQLFSCFSSNPNLLKLVADVLGAAPALGETLSRKPHLLYYAMTNDFYVALRSMEEMRLELAGITEHTTTEEEALERIQTYRHEMQFQVGVHLLRQLCTAVEAGEFLSDLADVVIDAVYKLVLAGFEKKYGIILSSGFGIIALGKLGSRELTFESDLDLMFIYDSDSELLLSSGESTFQPNVYYNRLAHRVIGLLTAPTREGKLFEVDTRLRPFGKDGPLVVSLAAFDKYYSESAWVFERLALTRARVVSSQERFGDNFRVHLKDALSHPVEPSALKQGWLEIRDKMHLAFGGANRWDIKHAYGGVLDIDLLLQYYMLQHYIAGKPSLPHNLDASLAVLVEGGILPATLGEAILASRQLQVLLLFHLRLSGLSSAEEIRHKPQAMASLLEVTGEKDFSSLDAALKAAQETIHAVYGTYSETSLPLEGGG